MLFTHFLKKNALAWIRPHIQLPVIGLDISDRSMKYLRFKSRGGLSIDAFGEIDIPAGVIEKGEIQQEDKLIQLFATWFSREKKRLRSKFVAVSLPEEKSFLRIIQLPHMDSDKVGNAIRWELEANIPLPLEDLSYDYEIIEQFVEGLDHIDVIVVAFPRTIVESYVRVLKRAGMQPIVLGLESQALVRSVMPSLGVRANAIIVDMGRTRTSFIIFAGNAIIFTTTIEVGGKHIEEAIVKALGVDHKQSVEIKKTAGLRKDVHEGKVFAALTPLLNQLVWKLRTSTDYYYKYAKHRHGSVATIGTIILSGGDSNLIGLDTYLSSALKTPVILADPFVSIRDLMQPSIPSVPRNQSLAYATAIGLVLRHLRQHDTRIT